MVRFRGLVRPRKSHQKPGAFEHPSGERETWIETATILSWGGLRGPPKKSLGYLSPQRLRLAGGMPASNKKKDKKKRAEKLNDTAEPRLDVSPAVRMHAPCMR